MGATYTGIKKRITEAILKLHNEKDEAKRWFSRARAEELLKDQDLEAALSDIGHRARWKSSASCVTVFVRERAMLLFVLLVYVGMVDILEEFYENNIDDAMFPVNDFKLNMDHTIIAGSKRLTIKSAEADPLFNYQQWMFFVPKLEWIPFDHVPLDSKRILPFLTQPEIQSRTEFSIVYKTIIHRDHVSIKSDGIEIASDSRGHPYVAVKNLLPSGLKGEIFKSFVKAEYEALDMLRRLKTQHLIKATAFYQQGENLYFIFPWAQHGNLRKFWREKTPVISDPSYMKWVFTQLHGLAEAIQALHYADDGRTCRHGDLKPENILCFNSSVTSMERKDHTSCILVISDVGLSRTHDKSTQLRSKTKIVGGETIAYSPPETELYPDQATSRRYDIWSLGCLYLEFVIWLLYGMEGLELFGKEIGGKFYTTTNHAENLGVGRTTVKMSPQVDKWIENIKKDPRCSPIGTRETAVFRLVDLIKERFLVTLVSVGKSNPRDPVSAISKPEEEAKVNVTNPQQWLDAPPFKLSVQAATERSLGDGRSNDALHTSKFAEAGKVERASAPEVCQQLNTIIRDVRDGTTEWLNPEQHQPEQTPLLGLRYLTSDNTRSIKGSVGKKNEYVR